MIPQTKKTIENKPRLGQGRAGIRHRKPQLTENITVSKNKSHKILKIPATQNVTKIEQTFQHENNQQVLRQKELQEEQYRIKIDSYCSIQAQFIGLLQSC